VVPACQGNSALRNSGLPFHSSLVRRISRLALPGAGTGALAGTGAAGGESRGGPGGGRGGGRAPPPGGGNAAGEERAPAPGGGGRPVKVGLVAIVGAVLAAVVCFPRPGFSPRPRRLATGLVPAPVALAPGVYLLGLNAPAAVYLVETSQGLVLIDSGLDPRADRVIRQLRELDFDVQQLRAILLTHVHADHSMGADY